MEENGNDKKGIFREITITDFKEISEIALLLKDNFIYRGQGNAQWKLETSLMRYHKNKFVTLKSCESAIVNKFKKNLISYNIPIKEESNLVEILSFIQHYGGPSRLLDFSKSFFVALYFAVNNNDDYDSSIWCIHKNNFQIDIHKTEDGYSRFKEVYSNYFYSNEIDENKVDLYFFEPLYYNKRMLAQQGCFVSCMNNDQSLDELLLAELKYESGYEKAKIKTGTCLSALDIYYNPFENDRIIKIIIPRYLHASIEQNLFHMNINSETLFRDISGMVKSLRTHYQNELESESPKNVRSYLAALFAKVSQKENNINVYICQNGDVDKNSKGVLFISFTAIIIVNNQDSKMVAMTGIDDLLEVLESNYIKNNCKIVFLSIKRTAKEDIDLNVVLKVLAAKLASLYNFNQHAFKRITVIADKHDKRLRLFHESYTTNLFKYCGLNQNVILRYRNKKENKHLRFSKYISKEMYNKNKNNQSDYYMDLKNYIVEEINLRWEGEI